MTTYIYIYTHTFDIYIYHIIYLLYIYYAYYMEHPQFHMGCKPLTKWDAHPRTVESQWNIGVPMDCNDSHQPKDWMKLASQRILYVRFFLIDQMV